MRKLILLIVILQSCVSPNKTPEKKMYIISVVKKEYSPISQSMERVTEIDTVYETNDLDAYNEGFISFHAIEQTIEFLDKNGGNKAASLVKPISFSVVNKEGIDISYNLTEKQKDSIKKILIK